ncbi:MAG: Uma2 family endonuclease [Acidobacteria bacterium]|nr:Uma2 family endonuclease [Acidobacteriota bacterium]
MAEAGVFARNRRLELIEGEIIEMSPIGRRHAARVRLLIQLLGQKLVAGEAILDVQDPIVLGDHSEPQPDLALLKPRADFYSEMHPRPEDVFLLIEVADSSLAYDREAKVPLYARYGVPEVWIADLEGKIVEVLREPTETGYSNVERFSTPETLLSPALLPHLGLEVSDLVG